MSFDAGALADKLIEKHTAEGFDFSEARAMAFGRIIAYLHFAMNGSSDRVQEVYDELMGGKSC